MGRRERISFGHVKARRLDVANLLVGGNPLNGDTMKQLPATVEFTIGAEAANAINVAVQVKDGEGNAIAQSFVFQAFLSDSAAGDGIVATAPDGGIAIGTDGNIIVADVANKVLTLQTEADGNVDITITESGADTFYLVVVLNGVIYVSDAITFAA